MTTQMNTQSPNSGLNLSQLLPGIADFDEFKHHDAPLKFWLPEVVASVVSDMAKRNGASASEALRQFFVQHCYGVVTYQLLLDYDSKLFKDDDGPVFSNKAKTSDERPGKKRIDTYWLPDLGKSTTPIKVWLPTRVKSDLQAMADHVGISLSQYAREIVISRSVGHAKLPMREAMLDAVDMSVAEQWVSGAEVPLRQVSEDEFASSLAGEFRGEVCG
jgi:hypothetical protein